MNTCRERGYQVRKVQTNLAHIICPGSVHEKMEMSLLATYDTDAKIVFLECKQGCTYKEILDKLGLTFDALVTLQTPEIEIVGIGIKNPDKRHISHLIGDMILRKYKPVRYLGRYHIFTSQHWVKIKNFDDLSASFNPDLTNAQKIELQSYLKVLCTKIDYEKFDTISLLGGKCIKDGELMDYDGVFTPYHIDLEFDIEASSIGLKKYIQHLCFGDLKEYNSMLQQIGYCLMPHKTARKGFIIKGEPIVSNSVFDNFICQMVGQNNISRVALKDAYNERAFFKYEGKLVNVSDNEKARTIENPESFFPANRTSEFSVRIPGTHRDISFYAYPTYLVGVDSTQEFKTTAYMKVNTYNDDTNKDEELLSFASTRQGRSAIMKLGLVGAKMLKGNHRSADLS